MKYKHLTFPVFVFLLALFKSFAQIPPALRLSIDQRDTAVNKADVSTWDRLTTEDFTVVWEDGMIKSKAQRIMELKNQTPTLFVRDWKEQIRFHRKVAIRTTQGPSSCATEVWVKHKGRWQVETVQVTPVKN